jgi:hypothetical protein
VCAYLEKSKQLWAIGFYTLPPERGDPRSIRAESVAREARGRVIPLLQPWSGVGPVAGKFGEGKYTEAVLQGYLQPQGFLPGVGEIPMSRHDLRALTFESPQMQTVFQVANEMKGMVMVHPRTSIAPRTQRSEIESALRKYPNALFLIHGWTTDLDLVLPLMSQYPNVYFTWDVQAMVTGPWTPKNLMDLGSAEGFLAEVNRIGVERILEESLRVALPRLQQHPDRIMWGTDQGMLWHFEDSVTDLIISISRQFIGRLPAEVQEAYAFRNAHRVFSRYLPAP